jgi:SET domain-containing protein
MPVLDMINHSLTPNAAVLPYVYNFDQSSYLQLVALRDIQPDE